MRTTGRRAWRKWARNRRRNARRAGFEWYEGSRKCALFVLHGQDMQNRATFTPRSLVGMTMGLDAKPALSIYWQKEAEARYDEGGRLIPWDL